jgi:hypothetical protein
MPKFAAKDADAILARLDKIAAHIEANHEAWGMPFETAKGIVNDLDVVADTVELGTFGEQSFTARQAEVLQKESDEGYMSTFANPMAPKQTESDEGYMKAYSDDQSSAVRKGKATNGRPLT